jgi:molybdate transport system ATP-binding protein
MSLSVAVEKRLGSAEMPFVLDAEFLSQGRITALFGRSGAGKSTLVNLIAGLLRPDRGSIRLDDAVLFDSAAGVDVPAHRRRIGYVVQEGRLFPHLSVRGNLVYGQRFTARQDRWATLDEIVDLLGIGALLDRRPAALSGGEKQRIAIGRAILSSPRLLLMDEPLTGLDQERKSEILPYIERLRDRMRMPIVYVSHAVDEVSRLADTVVLLDAGKVAAVGPVNDVLGSSAEMLADGAEAGVVLTATVLSHDPEDGVTHLHHPAGKLSIPLVDLAVGAPVRLRVRARDVALAVGDPGRISIRNRLAGTVIEIADAAPPSLAVRLDLAGAPLIANVTRDAVRDLDLKVGDSVTALIKSAAFDPLSVGSARISPVND